MRISACLLALALTVYADEGQGPVLPGPTEIREFDPGAYWYGAKITDKDLIGKVVLVAIWGSRVGCQAITPHLVSLAKRLEGKPFHAVAKLATQVGAKKNLPAAIRQIERRQAAEPGPEARAELDLTALQKDFKGTALVADVMRSLAR